MFCRPIHLLYSCQLWQIQQYRQQFFVQLFIPLRFLRVLRMSETLKTILTSNLWDKNSNWVQKCHLKWVRILKFCMYIVVFVSLWLQFDGLQNVKVKYMVLCLNALTKFRNARVASRHQTLMNNCPTCSYMSQPFQPSE